MTTLINTNRKHRHVYKVKKKSRLPSLNMLLKRVRKNCRGKFIQFCTRLKQLKLSPIFMWTSKNCFISSVHTCLCANIATLFISICISTNSWVQRSVFFFVCQNDIKTTRFSMCLHDTTEIKCRFFKGPQPSCVCIRKWFHCHCYIDVHIRNNDIHELSQL